MLGAIYLKWNVRGESVSIALIRGQNVGLFALLGLFMLMTVRILLGKEDLEICEEFATVGQCLSYTTILEGILF